MRELTFGLAHEPGHSPLMDVFHEYPELRTESAVCSWTDGSYWRVDRANGSAEALSALDEAYLDDNTCHDCLADVGSIRNRRIETFVNRKTQRIYYTYWEVDSRCLTVPRLAMKYFGPGTVLQSTRHDGEHWWRIIMHSDRKVGLFYDTVQAELPSEVRYVLGHLSDVRDWDHGRGDDSALSAKEEAVVEAAAELGYFETPREADQADIAASMGIPRSTVSYRLRRATSALAEAYLEGDDVNGETASEPPLVER